MRFKDINDTSAILIDEIIAPTCDKTVTSQGFVYAETTLPKTTDNLVEVNGINITKQINSLKQNKTYYYRTYFTNPIGTFYGNEITFKTLVGSATLNRTTIRNITAISAFADNYIAGNGEGEISQRGVCWSINQNPTTADSKTEDGTGIGQFSSELTNLKADTTYYLRTYPINEAGTTYGEEINFKTRDGVIKLTTNQISNITIDSAISGGNITNDGGAKITTRGICWSLNQNPTTADNKTENGTGNEVFSAALTNLNSDNTYSVRAYAVNVSGGYYGQEVVFKASNPYEAMYLCGTVFCVNVITSIIDITNPKTGKTWMDRNLGAKQVTTDMYDKESYGSLYQWGRNSDGHQCRNSEITSVTSSTNVPMSNLNKSKFIIGDNDWRKPSNQNLWQGANGINNPCTTGSRIPTLSELNEEVLSWNGTTSYEAIGSPLKLPMAGDRNMSVDGRVKGVDLQVGSNCGRYWSSSNTGTYGGITPSSHYLFFWERSADNIFSDYRGRRMSVRCIKD